MQWFLTRSDMFRKFGYILVLIPAMLTSGVIYSLEPRFKSEEAYEYFSKMPNVAVIMRMDGGVSYWQYDLLVSIHGQDEAEKVGKSEWSKFNGEKLDVQYAVLRKIKGNLSPVIHVHTDEVIYDTKIGVPYLVFFDESDSDGVYRINPFEFFGIDDEMKMYIQDNFELIVQRIHNDLQ